MHIRDHHLDHSTRIMIWKNRRQKILIQLTNINRITKRYKTTRLKMKVVRQWWMLLALVTLPLQSTTILSIISARQVLPTRLPSRLSFLTQMKTWKIRVLYKATIWQHTANLHQMPRVLQRSGNLQKRCATKTPVTITNRCNSSTVVQSRQQHQPIKTNPTLPGTTWIIKNIHPHQSSTRPSIIPILRTTTNCQNLTSLKFKTWCRVELEQPTPTHWFNPIHKLMVNRLFISANSTSTK